MIKFLPFPTPLPCTAPIGVKDNTLALSIAATVYILSSDVSCRISPTATPDANCPVSSTLLFPAWSAVDVPLIATS